MEMLRYSRLVFYIFFLAAYVSNSLQASNFIREYAMTSSSAKSISRRSSTKSEKIRLTERFFMSLNNVVKSLPNDQVCKFIDRFIEEKNLNYWSFVKLLSLPDSKMCANINSKYKKHAAAKTQVSEKDALPLMTRLYNSLPLPFQCNILTVTMLSRLGKLRHEHTSKFLRNDRTAQIVDKLEKKRKLGILVEDTEYSLTKYQNIMPVARQCSRLIQNLYAYSYTLKIKIRKKPGLKYDQLQKKLLEIIPQIVEKYAKSKGMDVHVDKRWENMRSSFLAAPIKRSETKKRYVLFVNLYLYRNNTGPRNANLILASLYDNGLDKIKKLLGTDVKFSTVIEKKNQIQRRYYEEEMTFPHYLSPYFQKLEESQQCFIIHLLATYSSKTSAEIVQSLLNNKRIETVICAETNDQDQQPSTQGQATTDPKLNSTLTKENSSLVTYKSDRSQAITKELSQVEILMIIVLSCAFVFSVAFLAICGLFHYRKRHFKDRKVLHVSSYNLESDLHAYYQSKSKTSLESQSVLDQGFTNSMNISTETTEIMVDEATHKPNEVYNSLTSDKTQKFRGRSTSYYDKVTLTDQGRTPCDHASTNKLDSNIDETRQPLLKGLSVDAKQTSTIAQTARNCTLPTTPDDNRESVCTNNSHSQLKETHL